jgi:PBSX family phage portal protein
MSAKPSAQIAAAQPAPRLFQARMMSIGKVVDDSGPLGRLVRGEVKQQSMELEDDWQGYYETATSLNNQNLIIQPPYNFYTLEYLVSHNNALGSCVDTMETNVDGTGFVIETDTGTGEPDEVQKQEIANLMDFFDEVYPGSSFMTLRKQVRRDLEVHGNAYIEVLRSADGKLVFLRRVDPKTMRLVRLDTPVMVTRKVMRLGREVEFSVWMRERRYAQKIDNRLIYFKEFKASRDIERDTGKWAEKGVTFNAQQRGGEIIHLTKNPDVRTPYGIPAWIAQAPSVVGSRSAEENNLSFFDSGGIPPIMVFISGGQMAEKSKQDMERHFTGQAKTKHKAAVLEVFGTGGSLEQQANVKIAVERFGAERQSDAMFLSYDQRCSENVRSAWRLPAIFLGRTQDYSYATAFASFTVGDAQVFQPERDEFDEMVNLKIMPEILQANAINVPENVKKAHKAALARLRKAMPQAVEDDAGKIGANPATEDATDEEMPLSKPGQTKYKFRSLPLAVKDVTQQLRAVELAASAKAISPEEEIKTLNEITNLNMQHDKQHYEQAQLDKQLEAAQRFGLDDAGVPAGAQPGQKAAGKPVPVAKSESYLTDLSTRYWEVWAGRDQEGMSSILGEMAQLPPYQFETVMRLTRIHGGPFVKEAAISEAISFVLDVAKVHLDHAH